MRIFETNATVDDQGNLVITVPTDMVRGEHRAVVVIEVPIEQVEQPVEQQPEEEAERVKTWPPPGFKVFKFDSPGPAPSLRRKDIYDTDDE